MQLSIEGKHALIGGGSQGIGKAIAVELAALGASCTLLARNEEALKSAVAELPSPKGQQHNYLIADYNNYNALEELISSYIKERPVDILINNSGGPAGGPVTEASAEAFLTAFQQHLICNHLLTHLVVPFMKTSGYGRIINIISTSVKIPLKNLGVSNTIRGAVASWSKTMSNELGKHGITVNNILPGATATARLKSIIDNKSGTTGRQVEEIEEEMLSEIPMGRFGQPEEIAAVAAFLATPAAAYVNGVSIPVDGGRTGTVS